MIIPAILQQNLDEFDAQLGLITRVPGVRAIQVDFADGVFVPEKSLSISDLPVLNPAFEWEAHLMVQNPLEFLDYQIAGFKRIVVHYEAFESEEALDDAVTAIKQSRMQPAIALKLETPVSTVRYFTDNVKDFLLMSIEPGKQGRELHEEVLQRIRDLRQIAPLVTIQVDGGINIDNIKSVFEAGADSCVVGSAIFAHGSISENFKHLDDTESISVSFPHDTGSI